jgi:hypothetical protein
MLLHWSFCAEWFDSKLKREFKIHLKIVLETLKIKRKGISLFPPSFLWLLARSASFSP